MTHRDRLGRFERAQKDVRSLDFAGKSAGHPDVYREYQRRNSFGLDLNMKIYRIFQQDYYEQDVRSGCLTLPLASASVWGDALENPLASVEQPDAVTGGKIDLGSVVKGFYALCWTQRAQPTNEDWSNFSHGKPAVRIATTVGKLLDRVMQISDSCYMHRSWVIDVDYKAPDLIRQMKTPSEVFNRMESTGAMLALSAATIQTGFSDEEEVRFLFDNKITPTWNSVTTLKNGSLVCLPFNWNDFVDGLTCHP